MGDEREQNGWLGASLRSAPATSSDACPDAETMAAWVDGGLSAQAAVAVEAHTSSCSRCMAVLATLERTAAPVEVSGRWTRARLFRWLVPLTAAATAVALWVVVPDRPVTPVQSSRVQDLEAARERADADTSAPQVKQPAVPVPVPVPDPVPVPVPDRQRRLATEMPQSGAEDRSAATSSQNLARAPAAPVPQVREELAGAGAATEGPPPPATPETSAAQAPMPVQERAADSVGGLTSTARQGSAFRTMVPVESAAPGNPRFRWRAAGSTSIERSTDGGKTWMQTAALPPDTAKGLTITGMRVLNGQQAIAQMSNGSEFYTANGGVSWSLLQENSPAPF